MRQAIRRIRQALDSGRNGAVSRVSGDDTVRLRRIDLDRWSDRDAIGQAMCVLSADELARADRFRLSCHRSVLTGWTRKEALVKATGEGLAGARAFTVSMVCGSQRAMSGGVATGRGSYSRFASRAIPIQSGTSDAQAALMAGVFVLDRRDGTLVHVAGSTGGRSAIR